VRLRRIVQRLKNHFELFGLQPAYALEGRIAERIDAQADAAGAADLVRRLMFLEKFDADIDAAFETIEA
jgi:hypothetical protein